MHVFSFFYPVYSLSPLLNRPPEHSLALYPLPSSFDFVGSHEPAVLSNCLFDYCVVSTLHLLSCWLCELTTLDHRSPQPLIPHTHCRRTVICLSHAYTHTIGELLLLRNLISNLISFRWFALYMHLRTHKLSNNREHSRTTSSFPCRDFLCLNAAYKPRDGFATGIPVAFPSDLVNTHTPSNCLVKTNTLLLFSAT